MNKFLVTAFAGLIIASGSAPSVFAKQILTAPGGFASASMMQMQQGMGTGASRVFGTQSISRGGSLSGQAASAESQNGSRPSNAQGGFIPQPGMTWN